MAGQDKLDRTTLFPPQLELLNRGFLESRENWIVISPTGSGKTRVAEWAIQRSISQGYSAAYLAPLRAIVQEKHEEWSQAFESVSIGLFTGETTRQTKQNRPKSQQLLLMTPEKLASYLQNWKRNLEWLSKLDLVVIDEFHLIGDRSRGACIESLIGRLQRVNPFCRFVALTATLSNAEELAEWLKAKVFRSDWRPIPLEQRMETFKKAEHKFEMLKHEIDLTLATNGRLLVFVNSRKRCETLAKQLKEQGYSADYNHAGLNASQRAGRRSDMSKGTTEVLITTSALEMGVNFPARKVVIYDSFGFDGDSFKPLSIQRYVQCAGRAGRPGLDNAGESVIFVPIWRKNAVDYLTGKIDKLTSGLFSSETIQREVLVEISSRLSISEDHLTVNFASRSWWNRQGGTGTLTRYVDELIDGGLVKRDPEEQIYLSATALGRVASQMSVCPATVLLFANEYKRGHTRTRFDLLLLSCLASETSPKLGFNFEEIEHIADLTLEVPSRFLDLRVSEFHNCFRNVQAKQLLSAVKTACVLYRRTLGEETDSLALSFDCYPADISLLARNACWTLDTAKRVFNILHDVAYRQRCEGQEDPPEKEPCRDVEVIEALALMLQYGIPPESIGLTQIPKIGPARARKLIDGGITTLGKFKASRPSDVAAILKIHEAAAIDMLAKAQTFDELAFSGHNEPHLSCDIDSDLGWTSAIDPYRLRRALELDVSFSSAEVVHVAGGAEPHVVSIIWKAPGKCNYECDCADFEKGTNNCKHIIRARLEVQDADEILELLRLLQTSRDQPVRFSLGELWMKVGDLYDRFNDRHVDYCGRRFLDQALSKERWSSR
jgi:helicase